MNINEYHEWDLCNYDTVRLVLFNPRPLHDILHIISTSFFLIIIC